MKTTIISILVIIGMAVTLWLGGCFSGGQIVLRRAGVQGQSK